MGCLPREVSNYPQQHQDSGQLVELEVRLCLLTTIYGYLEEEVIATTYGHQVTVEIGQI